MRRQMTMRVNGVERSLTTDEDRSLLEVLREDFNLTGAKYGCGEGECGACTVLMGNQPVRACITTIAEVDGEDLLTIEGLAVDGQLHAVQQAFIDKQAMQCGYCVPGQILAAVALLRRNPQPTAAEAAAAMNEHLCRCCNYPRLQSAVLHAARAE